MEDGKMLETGIRGFGEMAVTPEQTAKAVGSGGLEVLSTPAVIAGIEKTAWESVADYLEPGSGTVGTKVDINHISATPVGMKVRFETEVILVDRRRIVFRAEAWDEVEKIAEGTHERFVIQTEKFLRKAAEKQKKSDLSKQVGTTEAK